MNLDVVKDSIGKPNSNMIPDILVLVAHVLS